MKRSAFFLILIFSATVIHAQSKSDQIKTLTQRIDSLKSILSVRTQQVEAKQAQIYSWQQEVVSYKDKLAQAQKNIQELTGQLTILRDSVRDITRKNQELVTAAEAVKTIQPEETSQNTGEKKQVKNEVVKEKSKMALTWSYENLKVITFRNGDTIPQARSDAEWLKAGMDGKAAWCYYDYDPANENVFGKLYNWYAVDDPRGLAPEGWHIPSAVEWNKLTDYFGSDAGKKMKSTSGWSDFKGHSGNGTNVSGFNGLPAGLRYGDGKYAYVKTGGYWWTSTEYKDGRVHHRALYNTANNVIKNYSNKQNGLSVRCIKD